MCSWPPWPSSLPVSIPQSPEASAPPPLPRLPARGNPCPPPAILPTPRLPDRPGVTRREEIDHLQEVMALTLQSYIKGQPPRPGDRYAGAWGLGGCTRGRQARETELRGMLLLACPLGNQVPWGAPSPFLAPQMGLASESLLLLFHLIFFQIFFFIQ